MDDPKAAASNWKAIGGYKKYFKGLAAVSLDKNLTKHITNQFSLFGKLNDNFEKRPFNSLDDRTLNGGFRNKLSFHSSKTDWIVGLEWINEQYKWKLDKDNILLNENSENRKQINVFAMLYYRPTTSLNISVASALNQVSYRLTDLYLANGDQTGRRIFPLIISPRLGINYAPNDLFAVYGSIGHGFSLPSPEETLLPEGDVNQGIKPEQGIQYEIGTRLNLFGKTVETDATLYWIELSNLLVTKRITEDIFTGINAGRTRHQGFELLLRNRLFESDRFPGDLTATLSYSRSLNRFIDFMDNGNSYNGKNLPGIPDQSFHLQLKWNMIKKLELFTHLQYSGYQYLNDSNTLKYSGYFLADIKVTIQLKPGKKGPFYIYAGINNLTDKRYASMLIVNALGFNGSEPRYYYPGLPRHGYAGIHYMF